MEKQASASSPTRVSEAIPVVKKFRRKKQPSPQTGDSGSSSVLDGNNSLMSNRSPSPTALSQPVESNDSPKPNGSAEKEPQPSKLDMSGSLEYLRRWTLEQDLVTIKTAEHQKLMESMMQSVLQQITDGLAPRQAPLLPHFMFGALPTNGVHEAESKLESDEVESVTLSETAAERAARDEDVQSKGSEKSLGRLHSVFVDAIWKLPTKEHEDHRHWHVKFLEEFVENPKFEYFAACLIFFHSMFIGASVEYLASTSSEKHPFFVSGNIVFVIIFCMEVGLKVAAEREEYFHGVEWRWNIFDIMLITTVFIEIIMGSVSSGKSQKKSMKTVLKIAEMVRTIRILRIFRVLKFSLTLRVIVAKIITSSKSLIWIVILFCLKLYVVSVCLTQGCNDYLGGEQHVVGHASLTGTQQDMHRYFGSVPRSAFTLFASITGGMVWSDAWDVLLEASPFYAGAFLVFQALSILAVMNLITGIFVDNSIKADADIVMEAEQIERMKQAAHLTKMFERIDGDHSDMITLEEFMSFARDPSLCMYLEALNIGPDEAETLFHLLDEDASGSIKISEFLSGCLHLRGEATSLDMKTLLYENKRMRHKLFRHVHEMGEFVHYTESILEPLAIMQQKNGTPAPFDSARSRGRQEKFRYRPEDSKPWHIYKKQGTLLGKSSAVSTAIGMSSPVSGFVVANSTNSKKQEP